MIVSEVPTVRPARPRAQYAMLDAWRGFAALWVVMVHACHGEVLARPELTREPLYAFSTWGYMGVIMFFVISGYCITAAVESAARKPLPISYFVRARLRRIYPPYFASVVLCVLLGAVFNLLSAHHVIPRVNHLFPFWRQSPMFYVATATLTQEILHFPELLNVYWSLCYEIAFYGIMVAMLGLLCRRSPRAFYFSLNSLTLVSLLVTLVVPNLCPFPLNLWPLFGFGCTVYMVIMQPQKRSALVWLGATIFVSVCYALVHHDSGQLPGPGAVLAATRAQMLFCVVFVLSLIALHRFDGAMSKHPVSRAFAWLGTISYSLYLTHQSVNAIPQQFMKRMGFVGELYWVTLLVQIVVSILVAYGFHLVCERPFLNSRGKALNLQAADLVPKQEACADPGR